MGNQHRQFKTLSKSYEAPPLVQVLLVNFFLSLAIHSPAVSVLGYIHRVKK